MTDSRTTICCACRSAIVLFAILGGTATAAIDEPAQPQPAHRQALHQAVDFLAREVPAWPEHNGCYSCHNNGDGARALYLAADRFDLPKSALAGTSKWLRQPAKWTAYGDKAEFSDDRLATLQFAVALATARQTGHAHSGDALKDAARRLADYQRDDGSFAAQDNSLIGSPVTYGPYLSTHLARQVFQQTDATAFAPQIARATRWLQESQPKSIFDSAAVLWAVADAPEGSPGARQRTQCLQRVTAAQGTDGGWGPYANSSPEVFDTAVALLALMSLPGEPQRRAAVDRGVAFLTKQQLADGRWPGTTRPPDGGSYAQQISTAAWAALALLEYDRLTAPAGEPNE